MGGATVCSMPRPVSKRPGRYTPPISKQVEARLQGVTREMALEALEAELAAEGGPIAELQDFAHAEAMREGHFVAKVGAALAAGHQWAELGAVFGVSGPTLRQRYRRARRALEQRYGFAVGDL